VRSGGPRSLALQLQNPLQSIDCSFMEITDAEGDGKRQVEGLIEELVVRRPLEGGLVANLVAESQYPSTLLGEIAQEGGVQKRG